jgi:hypothetical protein
LFHINPISLCRPATICINKFREQVGKYPPWHAAAKPRLVAEVRMGQAAQKLNNHPWLLAPSSRAAVFAAVTLAINFLPAPIRAEVAKGRVTQDFDAAMMRALDDTVWRQVNAPQTGTAAGRSPKRIPQLDRASLSSGHCRPARLF